MTRLIAIGDIHGGSYELAHVLKAIGVQSTDTIVTVGDYVDRGIDSKGVLDVMISLAQDCHLVPILGNHDEMMLRSRDDRRIFRDWLGMGGGLALDSYGETRQIDLIPQKHFQFLETCQPYFETDEFIFTHANYDPDRPFDQQRPGVLRWESLKDRMPGMHLSGKTVVLGHTPRDKVLNLGHLICVDTGCGFDGPLTAMDVKTGQIWQST